MAKDNKQPNFRIYSTRKMVLMSTSVAACAGLAMAETPAPSIQSILSTMNTPGSSETVQWQLAPSYSDLFGLGLRGTVGGYVSEDFALGAIIDYAQHREEYIANAGVKLNESLRVIGTVGLLKESEEFTLGDGREDVRQLQYGLSLKGSYDAGIMRGFEVNAYHTNASSDAGNVETGDLTGLQLMAQLKPSTTADLRLGIGYEQAKWANGDIDEGITLQAVGTQQISDVLTLNYSAKSAETENVFGLGFSYDLSTPSLQNNALSISFNKIEGKHGISDDTRLALTWTLGLGGAAAGSNGVAMSSMGGMPSSARKDLLADVMTRPAFLPERVLVNSTGESDATCPFTVLNNGLNQANLYYKSPTNDRSVTVTLRTMQEQLPSPPQISLGGVLAWSDTNRGFYSIYTFEDVKFENNLDSYELAIQGKENCTTLLNGELSAM